jgi:hypothetical protein
MKGRGDIHRDYENYNPNPLTYTLQYARNYNK